MERKWLIPGALLGLCSALSSWAGNGGPSEAPLKPGTYATVRCVGIFQVPITEDAERTMPLRLIGGASCGEQVTILAHSLGSTVRIRTTDGKNGYVERRYVVEGRIDATNAEPPESTNTGIARWQLGAPGCDRFFNGGLLVESLTAERITVQISLQDTGRRLRASVAIANRSGATAQFDPASFTLDELTPRLRSLPYSNPSSLFNRRAEHASVTGVSAVAPSATAADRPMYRDAALVHSAPDYLQPDATQLHTSVLRARTLAPNEKASGAVWFERDKDLQELTLRIFVNDQIFEFPLSFPHQN